jgi:CyaY protein
MQRSMTDQEFLEAADQVFIAVEDRLDATELDLDIVRSGNVLSVEFPGGSKLIINTQQPLHEMWMADKTGGFHYKLTPVGADQLWHDTRSGEEFFATLDRLVAQQTGQKI